MATAIEHPCKFLPQCGGCADPAIYGDSLFRSKVASFQQSLQSILSQSPVFTAHSTSNNFEYRSRALFRLHLDRKGLKIGFFEHNSRNLVHIDSCLNLTPPISRWLRDFTSSNIRSEDPEKYRILVQEVLANGSESLIFYIVPGQKQCASMTDVISAMKEHPLCVWAGDHQASSTAPFFTYYLGPGDTEYYTTPTCFQQANKKAADSLRRLLHGKIEAHDTGKIIELFSGSGYFSLELANKSRKVLGYDNHLPSIKCANRSVKKVSVNARYIVHDLYGDDDSLWKAVETEDIMVADPPRCGLREVADRIIASQPKSFFYISCDTQSLITDLKKLSGSYEIRSVDVIDFLPNTTHLETLTELKLANY